MKKLISLCLALALVMSLSVVAFAADETDVGVGDYSTAVTGSTVNGTTGGTVFMVDITWTGMNFTYHGAKEPTWDAENHTYTDRVAAWWEGQGTISIVNDSNTRIYAAPSYEAATGYEDADMVFSTDKLHVASAEYGTQQSGTITVTPSGSLPNNTENKTIGTITVTIAEDPDVTYEEVKMLRDACITLRSDIRSSDSGDIYNEKYSDLVSAVEALCSGAESTYTEADVYLKDNANPDPDEQARVNGDYASLKEFYTEVLSEFNAFLEA